MKLATLKAGGRDGTLIVVTRDLARALAVPECAATLQQALDDWSRVRPLLAERYQALDAGEIQGFALDVSALAAPLPRGYQWLDGSAYLSHVERVRRARGAGMPPSFLTDPLMYQGGSDHFLGPCDPITAGDRSWGIDFEAEVAIITDDVPEGTTPDAAAAHIVLVLLVNDISLRNLIPAELTKGFGFLHGKPPTACSPVAVSPEALGPAWDGRKLHLPLLSYRNGEAFGNPETGCDMQFDFAQLISHACKTRPLGAGTLIGSGTVSNADPACGFSCIVERRMVETIVSGSAGTEFLGPGESVRIEMLDRNGKSIFGAIQQVVLCPT